MGCSTERWGNESVSGNDNINWKITSNQQARLLQPRARKKIARELLICPAKENICSNGLMSYAAAACVMDHCHRPMALPIRIAWQCALLIGFSITLSLSPTHTSAVSAPGAPPPGVTRSTVAIGSGRWSDPTIWRGGLLPGPGDLVVISSGTVVQLDTNASTASLTISGPGAVLSCLRNRDLPPTSLRSGDFALVLDVTTVLLVERGGCFSCGAGDCQGESEQYAGRLTIRLGGGGRSDNAASGPPPTSAEEDMRTLLVRDGGALYLSGSVRAPAITRLAVHARPGDTSIVVSDAAVASSPWGWQPGDLIAIAPTDYAPSQTEFRTVVEVLRTSAAMPDASKPAASLPPQATLQLDKPLAYAHNGRRLDIPGSPNGAGNFVVDARAEVALLSRSIVIEGVSENASGLGGDVKIVGRSSRLVAKWTEFRFLGRRGHLGRYPLHLHGAAEGAVIAGVSIHDSYQRGVVLHCTNGAQVSDTVVAGVPGFAFMLEDGAEENNTFTGNLAMDVLNAIQNTSSVDTEHGNPAGFWFVNPANSFVGNMAAGAHGVGYSWEMLRNRTASYTLCPQDVPGYDVTLFAQRKYYELDTAVYGAVMRKNFAEFHNNSVHSAHSGIWFRNDIGGLSSRVYYPSVQSVISAFTVYNLAPRAAAPPGVEGSHHDGCVHISGISRLKLARTACVNSARVYWSSDSNVLEDTLMAWIGSAERAAEDGEPHLLSERPSDDKWRYNQALISYTSPATFVNTHVRGTYGHAVFVAMGVGSLASATGTVVRGFSYDAATVLRNFDLVFVLSQSPHVLVDEAGMWLGAGPDARVLPSCVGCGTNPDPVIEAYAPGFCLPVGTAAKGGGSSKGGPDVEYVSQPQPLTGGVIRGLGATPLVCAGPNAPRFAAIRLSVEAAAAQQRAAIDFRVFAASSSSGQAQPVWQYLRNATQTRELNAAFFLAPLTRAAVSPFGGYRLTSPTAWDGLRRLVLSMSPVAGADVNGITIVLGGLPTKNLRYSSLRPDSVIGGSVGRYGEVRMVNGSGAFACADLVAAACAADASSASASSSSSSTVAPCICIDQVSGDVYVRLVASKSAVDPTMFDSHGELSSYQSESVHLIWDGDVATAAPVAKGSSDFDQLTRYMRGG